MESDNFESAFFAKGDTLNYEGSDCPFWDACWSVNPRIVISTDSVIMLQTLYHHWDTDCENIKIGPYEWQHTFVIDDRWLIDAWIEYQTGEHPSCTKNTWYEE